MTTPRDELFRLLDALCEDRIDDAGVAQLQEQVLADPEARKLYVEYVTLHGLLYWDAVAGTGVGEIPPVEAGELPRPAAAGPSTAPSRWRQRVRPLLPLAAGLLLMATIVAAVWNRGGQPLARQNSDGVPGVVPSDSAIAASDNTDAADVPAPVRLPTDPNADPATAPPATELAVAPTPRGELVSFIDSQLAEEWKASEVVPSPTADDSEWVRRAYLDLAGHIPDVGTVESFVADATPDKRARLVEKLLAEPTFAANLSTIWTNLLVGRAPERDIDREALARFLREQFWKNRPWTETMTELVAAEGSERESAPSNFLLAHLNNQAVPATAITARIFLCQQVQCSQCHLHPVVKDWGQEQFWELNAFFQQTQLVETMAPGPDGRPQMTRSLVNKPEGGPTYFENLNGVMRVAYPKFEGREISREATVNRRRELARLMSEGDRPQLAKAFVNRMWSQLFGRGFTTPIDDMGPHNPPSHPEILEAVTEEFVKSGYDVKQLVRWLTRTQLYQLSSRPVEGNAADAPDEGAAPLFTRMYLKPLTAEQVFDSLIASTSADKAGIQTWSDAAARRKTWLAQFYSALDNEENSDATTFDGSLPQALVMMNGELVREAISGKPGTALHSILAGNGADVDKLKQLALSTLSREPTPSEVAAFRQSVRQNLRHREPGEPTVVAVNESLSDAYWAYLNSSEFLVNH